MEYMTDQLECNELKIKAMRIWGNQSNVSHFIKKSGGNVEFIKDGGS